MSKERFPYEIDGENIELVGEESAVEKALDRLNQKPEIRFQDIELNELTIFIRVMKRNGYDLEIETEVENEEPRVVHAKATPTGEYQNE
jgi:hypothetical protein